LTNSKLEPRLSTDEMHEILTASLNNVYTATNMVPVAVGKPKTDVCKIRISINFHLCHCTHALC